MARRITRSLAWFVGLTAGIVLLWVAEVPLTDGANMGFAVVRVAGLAVGTYLLAVSALRVVVDALPHRWPSLVVASLTVPTVRHVLDAVVGTTAFLAIASGPAFAHDGSGPGEPPVLRHLDEDGRASAEARPLSADSATWTVRSGDHFWSIAEEVVANALERPPTDAEVARYWLQLIEANRARLVHPAVPDLIYPGQEFVLPSAP